MQAREYAIEDRGGLFAVNKIGMRGGVKTLAVYTTREAATALKTALDINRKNEV
jgi:hypothetical protein